MRARLAADVQPSLRFAVIPFELGPLDRPVHGQAVQRLEPEVLFGEAIARAAPMQRQTADGHRHRDDAGGLLILDVVVVPRMLAVLHRPFAIAAAVLGGENRSAGLDTRYPPPRAKPGQAGRR